MISSFFSQGSKGLGTSSELPSSSNSPIDLTVSDNEERPVKKRKMEYKPALEPVDPQPQPKTQHAPASQWRYDPSPSPEKHAVDPQTKKRRELFSKRLLEDNSLFIDTTERSDGGGLPSGRTDGAPEPDSSGAESESGFKRLQELFARKVEQKKKGKERERTSRKQATVGPSGEPYTALELQVWSTCLD
jgi:hypothetical protein